MTKTTINTLNTFTNGSPEDTIALLNQSATISQTVLQHVFKWTSRELRDAATDTWRLIISPMGPDTADKRFPSQTENGKIKITRMAANMLDHTVLGPRYFRKAIDAYRREDHPPWTVIGTLPGDQDSRDGRVKHTFSEKWLQYAWTSGRPGDQPKNKNRASSEEQSEVVDAVSPLPLLKSAKKRRASGLPANSERSGLVNSGNDLEIMEIDDPDVMPAAPKNLPPNNDSATVFVAVCQKNQDGSITMCRKSMPCRKLSESVPGVHPSYTLDKLRTKLKCLELLAYGVDGTRVESMSLCEDVDEEDNFIQSEYLRIPNSRSDSINFLLVKDKGVERSVPLKLRLASEWMRDEMIVQPPPAQARKKVKVSDNTDRDAVMNVDDGGTTLDAGVTVASAKIGDDELTRSMEVRRRSKTKKVANVQSVHASADPHRPEVERAERGSRDEATLRKGAAEHGRAEVVTEAIQHYRGAHEGEQGSGAAHGAEALHFTAVQVAHVAFEPATTQPVLARHPTLPADITAVFNQKPPAIDEERRTAACKAKTSLKIYGPDASPPKVGTAARNKPSVTVPVSPEYPLMPRVSTAAIEDVSSVQKCVPATHNHTIDLDAETESPVEDQNTDGFLHLPNLLHSADNYDPSPEQVILTYPSGYCEHFSLAERSKGRGHKYSRTLNPFEDLIKTIDEICIQSGFGAQEELQARRQILHTTFNNGEKSGASCLPPLHTIDHSEGRWHIDMKEQRFDRPLRPQLVEHFFAQLHDRLIADSASLLERTGERSVDSTYGELLPQFLSTIFLELGLTDSCKYLDLGSGVGQTCMQASLETQCESFGVEWEVKSNLLATAHLAQFEKRSALWGLRHGEVHLRKGDFLKSAFVDDLFRAADVVLANNFRMEPETALALEGKLVKLLKRGACVVSTSPLKPTVRSARATKEAKRWNGKGNHVSPNDKHLVERDGEDDHWTWKQRIYAKGSVSWSQKQGLYYISVRK